jgi:hypothetical protein
MRLNGEASSSVGGQPATGCASSSTAATNETFTANNAIQRVFVSVMVPTFSSLAGIVPT